MWGGRRRQKREEKEFQEFQAFLPNKNQNFNPALEVKQEPFIVSKTFFYKTPLLPEEKKNNTLEKYGVRVCSHTS